MRNVPAAILDTDFSIGERADIEGRRRQGSATA
jgi:hypothetical protein